MVIKQEKTIRVGPGGPMLALAILSFPALLGAAIYMGRRAELGDPVPYQAYWWVALGIAFLLWMLGLAGFFIVEPNGSKALVLFGSYKGTVKEAGFHWANPFFSKKPISLRARTLNGDRLKVNDFNGNPVEIAAIIVWAVNDTFEALFEVDDYEDYVTLQSETAVRHLAQSFPYDGDDEQISLRQNIDEVSEHLKAELQVRLQRAGVTILEARLAHLAYAQEIAGAMLRRQQASAILAARKIIVDGAVGMVEIAVHQLDQDETLKLDDERKAAMVSNLMVVLCSDHGVTPVLNTGTLYN